MKFFATSRLSENIVLTDEGYLICLNVPIARTGEMFYAGEELPVLDADEDGKIVILRDADAVFDPKTIASFQGKPVTLGHPEDFVSPENWKELSVGTVNNVRRGTGETSTDLIADLLITDAEAINLVQSGLREVSCGYDARYEQLSEGRGRQTNIVGNHLALVDKGRAGASYAINDHQGESEMKWSELFKNAKVAKAVEDAMKEGRTTDANTETPEEKKGFVSYDDFMKGMDALGEKILSAVGAPKEKGKDVSTAPTESQPAKIVAEDDDAMEAISARLTKLEAALAKILKSMGSEDDDGDDEVTDEDSEDEEGELVGDEDMPEAKTGDAARIEILAPGMNPDSKDAKRKAVVAAYGTKDGKAAIDGFTGGKKPNFKDEKQVHTLFIGASEVLKLSRKKDFAKTKSYDSNAFVSQMGVPSGAMTPEELNEKHAKHWETRKAN